MNVSLRELKTVRENVEKTLKGIGDESNKVAFISHEIRRVEQELARVPTKELRRKLETELDVYRNELEEVDVSHILRSSDEEANSHTNFPLLFDDEFNRKLFSKYEIHKHLMPKQSVSAVSNDTSSAVGFSKRPIQRIVSAYMNPSTPYNGLLLWHGVGAGKTCSCISIAENYTTEHPITVLLPADTFVETWQNEIYNYEKEKEKHRSGSRANVQCTGTTYTDKLPYRSGMSAEQEKRFKRLIGRVIAEKYEFLGYRKFANRVKKVIGDEKVSEYLKIRAIQRHFSNRVFILDEVHYTRQYDTDTENKDIAEYLELIARYGENNKFILASATPMYNTTAEIVEILNLLLLNDKRSPIVESDVFMNDGLTIKPEGRDILVKKSRGYISFLRGENPVSFPLKIYPVMDLKVEQRGDGSDEFRISSVQTYVPNPDYEVLKDKRVRIKASDKIKEGIRFLGCPMSRFQFQCYERAKSIGDGVEEIEIEQKATPKKSGKKAIMNVVEKVISIGGKGSSSGSSRRSSHSRSYDSPTSEEDVLDEARDTFVVSKSDNFNLESTFASNIVFPVPDNEDEGDYGTSAFSNCFATVNTQYEYEPAAMIKGLPFLHRDRIAKYSSKFAALLQLLVRSEGITFMYSRYLRPGAISLALLLEQNGYNQLYARRHGNTFEYYTRNLLRTASLPPSARPIPRCYCGTLKSEHTDASHAFTQGCYILLTAETPKDVLNALVSKARSAENIDGREVKAVIGSSVLSVGISLFNVREVHVLEPWYHFNLIEQVVGRAIRFQSHKLLPPEKRNVSVFLYCATLPTESTLSVETTDERAYRLAYMKSRKTAHVSRILKMNAFDCMLNKNGNQLSVDYFQNTPMSVVTSQGLRLRNMYYGDKKGDAICDYESCEYKCVGEPDDFELVKYQKVERGYLDDILDLEDKSEAKQIVRGLYGAKNAYTVDEILDAFRRHKYEDEDVVFRGLNEMVLNGEEVVDAYGREGFLAYRHPYYLFTPFELPAKNESMMSRSLPLAIRKNSVTIEEVKEVVTKPVPKEKEAKEVHDKTKVQEEKAGRAADEMIQNLRDYLKQVDANYIQKDTIYGDLSKELGSEFIRKLGSKCAGVHVGLECLAEYYRFSVIDRLEFDDKRRVIEHVLCENILRKGVFLKDDPLERTVFHLYDKQGVSKRYAIFRERRDGILPDAKTDYPVMYRLYREKDSRVEPVFYMYDPSKNEFREISEMKYETFSERYGLKYDDMRLDDVEDKVYGYIQHKQGRGGNKPAEGTVREVEFYLANRLQHELKKNKDDTIQEKSVMLGSVCGTSSNLFSKSSMVDLVAFLLDVDKNALNAPLRTYLESKNKNYKYMFGEFSPKGSLCEIIEMLLRHRQYIQPSAHFFYNMEEWMFVTYQRNREKSEVKGKEVAKKGKAKKAGV